MKKVAACLLSFVFICTLSLCPLAASSLQSVIDSALGYLMQTNEFGQWSLLAHRLTRNDVPQKAVAYLKDDIRQSAGQFNEVTQVQGYVLSLTAANLDPYDFEGRDFVSLLFNFDDLYKEGILGAVLSLIAVDSADFEIPADAKYQRQDIVDSILEFQEESGGFVLSKGGVADVALTAYSLTALSRYTDQEPVRTACDKALEWLGSVQNEDGSYSLASGMKSCENTALVASALSAQGISSEDPRFVKESSALTALSLFQNSDGGFAEQIGMPSEADATELAILALYGGQNQCSPFYLGSLYVLSEPASTWQVILRFFLICGGIVVLIYLLLEFMNHRATKKHPFIPDEQTEQFPETEEENSSSSLIAQSAGSGEPAPDLPEEETER